MRREDGAGLRERGAPGKKQVKLAWKNDAARQALSMLPPKVPPHTAAAVFLASAVGQSAIDVKILLRHGGRGGGAAAGHHSSRLGVGWEEERRHRDTCFNANLCCRNKIEK